MAKSPFWTREGAGEGAAPEAAAPEPKVELFAVAVGRDAPLGLSLGDLKLGGAMRACYVESDQMGAGFQASRPLPAGGVLVAVTTRAVSGGSTHAASAPRVAGAAAEGTALATTISLLEMDKRNVMRTLQALERPFVLHMAAPDPPSLTLELAASKDQSADGKCVRYCAPLLRCLARSRTYNRQRDDLERQSAAASKHLGAVVADVERRTSDVQQRAAWLATSSAAANLDGGDGVPVDARGTPLTSLEEEMAVKAGLELMLVELLKHGIVALQRRDELRALHWRSKALIDSKVAQRSRRTVWWLLGYVASVLLLLHVQGVISEVGAWGALLLLAGMVGLMCLLRLLGGAARAWQHSMRKRAESRYLHGPSAAGHAVWLARE